ncbi:MULTISPECIES: S8 family peptidase [Actinosynnema]|uniref:S8 family peptidase n=1 Tax=Actinosynnema TaxID=40566 RepID=UPI0020A5D910|nr:S8 family peptidase [Actinosynnema pretiosum]MCP2095697.1 Peptidase inhibitor I9 [Actinosynnema pretiosum]
MRKNTFAAGVAAVTVGLALTAPPAQAAPTGTVLAEGSALAVPGSYVVQLKDTELSAQDVTASAHALAARYGGRAERIYGAALRGFSARLGPAAARRLAADPAVALVEQDQRFTATTTQSPVPSWGLDRIDQRYLPLDNSYTYTSTGLGVDVYVIDSGVRIAHPEFGGRAVDGYDAVENDNVAQDGNGSGTYVAGIIAGSTYGVAKQARIIAVRVLDNAGSGTTAGLVAGINWTVNHYVSTGRARPAAVNLGVGGGASTALDNAVASAVSRGLTVGVPAGDSNANAASYSPARVASAITVGATTRTDARTSSSNYGAVLDIFAPGASITSVGSPVTRSGTPTATPHVVGCVARHLQANPTATPAQVQAALISYATPGIVAAPGTGSPNRLLHCPPTL